MSIQYQLAIDYADDGNFNTLGDLISTDVLEASWRLGMAQPYEHLSAISQAEILLRNRQQDFSPELAGNLIGKRLRIQSDDGTTTRTHFIGAIAALEIDAGTQGKRHAKLLAYGREYELTQQKVRLPLLTNFRADEAIQAILQQMKWRYAVLDGMCIIGRDSIGSSDIFPDEALSQIFDAGKSVFPYLGDDWQTGLLAQDAIEQLATAEGGRFYFNREGEALFANRHHFLQDDSLAATFSDDMAGMVYRYGGAVLNEVEVAIRPRSIGAANTVLWTLANPIRIARESSLEITASYALEDVPVGALNLVLPQAITHYLANSAADGSGTDMSSSLHVILRESGASAARLEIRNNSRHKVFLTFAELRGTAVLAGNPVSLNVQDKLSQTYYGAGRLTLSIPILADVEEAQAIASWELSRRKTPQGIVREISINTRLHPTESLALSLFDRIRITESQTGHERDYLIVAESHHVDKAGTRHRVSYLLEPAESGQFFIVGTHDIGDSTVVLVPR